MNRVLILVFFGSLRILTSCSIFSDEKGPKTELEKLPAVTNMGKNTFGCLVNGEAFLPRTTQAVFQQGQLQFTAHDYGDDFDEGVWMKLGDPLSVNQEYLVDGKTSHCGYQKRTGENICTYEPENVIDGGVIFSKIDRTNWIISGVFEFTVTTTGCDTIRFTDGRFDLQYTP